MKEPRIFLLLAKKTKPNSNFNLNNLSGEERIDLICRVITNVFFLGGGERNFRNYCSLWIYFQSYGKKLVLDGQKIRGLNPDERSIAGMLKKVFGGKNIDGFTYSSAKWEEILSIFPKAKLVDPSGVDIKKTGEKPLIYIVGDHIGISDEERNLFNKNNRINLGETIYLTSQCVTIINYFLDNH